MSIEIKEQQELKIYLNIYDLHCLNNYLHPIGLGAYHTGVQILDIEYAFGANDDYNKTTGVYESLPKQSCRLPYKTTLMIGITRLNIDEIYNIIDELKNEYGGRTYNLFTRNCNHFSNDLCKRLVGKNIPRYINRLACIFKYFKCILPKEFLEKNDPIVTRKKYNKKNNNHNKNDCKNKGLGISSLSQIEVLSLTKNEEKQDVIIVLN